MQTYVHPVSEHLRSISAWVVTDLDGPTVGIVRFVGLYNDAPQRVPGPPHIVDGPPIKELTCQGASSELTEVVDVDEHDQLQISRSLLRSAAVDIGIPNLLAGIPGLLMPHTAAMSSLKAAITAKMRWEATESVVFTTDTTRRVQRTVKINISEQQDQEIVLVPQYHRYEFPLYLSYIDFLFINYATGKKLVFPTRDLPDRRHRRLFSRGRPVRNEIHMNILLGTIEFYKYVDTKIVYKSNADSISFIDPQESTLRVGVGRGTDEQPILPVSLYEIAKSKHIPKWPDRAREELRI